MKAAVANVPLGSWLLKRPDWFDHQTGVGLTFAIKTFAASLPALYIAFWAGLEDPRWSFLTVFVVSQPDSGLVLAKSFYRILGTIAGLLVAVALVFGLAQYGELFLAAVAVWICFCNFAARAVRNFASYGFQLAGYTVAIVGIPAALVAAGWSWPTIEGDTNADRCTRVAYSHLARCSWCAQLRYGEILPLFAMDPRRPGSRQCGYSRARCFGLRR
jgi:hypothetical protein